MTENTQVIQPINPQPTNQEILEQIAAKRQRDINIAFSLSLFIPVALSFFLHIGPLTAEAYRIMYLPPHDPYYASAIMQRFYYEFPKYLILVGALATGLLGLRANAISYIKNDLLKSTLLTQSGYRGKP